MRNAWSFSRPVRWGKRIAFLIVGGLIAFALGYFAVRPLFVLFGLVS